MEKRPITRRRAGEESGSTWERLQSGACAAMFASLFQRSRRDGNINDCLAYRICTLETALKQQTTDCPSMSLSLSQSFLMLLSLLHLGIEDRNTDARRRCKIVPRRCMHGGYAAKIHRRRRPTEHQTLSNPVPKSKYSITLPGS